MIKSFVAATALATIAGLLPFSASARAGAFLFENGCETVSPESPRFALRFWLIDTGANGYGAFCHLRIEPTTHNGSAIVPIIGCTAPVALTCETDSTGTAVFESSPCAPDYWVFNDSLAIMVDGLPAYFVAELVTDRGNFSQLVEFPCPGLTAVQEPVPDHSSVRLASANPTHDNARVELDLAEASWVRVLVFDIRGRGVRELARRVMSAGRHTLEWDLRDDAGARVTQGVYFYQVWFGARKEARRLVVVR